MGDVGTGKTTLAMLVSKAALEAGRSVAIYSLPRLLALIRDVDRRPRPGMIGFLERLAAVDLLHIDDLGAENTTDWVLEQLYSIVNTRYEDERAMIVTTNLDATTSCASSSASAPSRGWSRSAATAAAVRRGRAARSRRRPRERRRDAPRWAARRAAAPVGPLPRLARTCPES